MCGGADLEEDGFIWNSFTESLIKMESKKDSTFTITVDYSVNNDIRLSEEASGDSISVDEYRQARMVIATANQELISIAKKTEGLMFYPMNSVVLN